MNNFENNQDANSGEENKGRHQVVRGEEEWRALLSRAERETARFFKLYEETFNRSEAEERNEEKDRLDICALAMDWIPSTETSDDENPLELLEETTENSSSEFPPLYSLHNLPGSIAISAISGFARSRWALLWKTPYAGKISARTAASISETLSSIERDMLLALDAEDGMEFGLALCLMKNVHAQMNRHFAEMECLPAATHDARYQRYIRELRCAIMDLRELCLRIINDARDELKKATRGN